MEIISTDSWAPTCKRTKILLGDKILYYMIDDERRNRMRHEIDMMSVAKENGIRVPDVYFYDAVGGTEICIMEFVVGRKATEDDVEQIDEVVKKFDVIKPPSGEYLFKDSLVIPDRYSGTNVGVKELFDNSMHEIEVLSGIRKCHKLTDRTKERLAMIELFEDVTLHHGDLSLDNVIVAPNQDIVLIDWECAGYLPREFTRAVCNKYKDSTNSEIHKVVKLVQYLKIGDKDKSERIIDELNI